MTRRGAVPGSGMAVALLLLAAAGSVAAADETVSIGEVLQPAQLQIEVGSTVTWRNDDDERHRVRSDDGPARFDSGDLDPGESFSRVFTLEGTYAYGDHRNRDLPGYAGTIVVGAAGDTPEGSPPDSGTISIVDKSFQPGTVTISTGGTVEWRNVDGETHTVTSADGSFDSDLLADGSTYARTFEAAGSYPYLCLIHPEMRGTITVADVLETDPADQAQAPSAAPAVLDADAGDTLDGLPGTEPAVSIVDRRFDPVAIEVVAGTTVTWANEDGEGHTVTAVDGSFNSGVMSVGAEYAELFETPGTFDYFCAIHPEMTGTVTVEAP